MPGLETVALSVVAGRGAALRIRPGRAGRTCWSTWCSRAPASRSSRDIVEVIEAEGGQINAATGYERTSFQVRALKGGLDLGMAVLADLVLRPPSTPPTWPVRKQVVAQEIAEAADAPDDYVFELVAGRRLLRPPAGPADPGHGRQRQFRSPPTAWRHWRGELYAADRLIVSCSGAVELDELLNLARARVRAMPASGGALADDPGRPSWAAARAKSASWSRRHLVFMLPAVSAREDDYFALRIFAEALGGGMSSRLFQEAREKRGLAYNIDAYADTYADAGALGVYAGCAAGDAETAKVCAEQIALLAARIATPNWPAPRPS
jgi:predicted Zn-dependent peptidase